jgi:proliferating cell nuclear antigen PCNA
MFEQHRLYIQSMDSSRVSIFEIDLPAKWFDLYELEQPTTIGISSSMLFKVLHTRDKVQEMCFVVQDENPDKLEVHFTSDSKTVFDKHFELPLMELDCDVMDIPQTDSQAELKLPSINFSNLIAQLRLFGETLEIKCDEEKIEMYSLSSELGKMTVDIDIDDLTEYSINEGQCVRLSFSLTILQNICMYSKLTKEVELKLTENFPLNLTYYLGDGGGRMSFYLAPKIQDDA